MSAKEGHSWQAVPKMRGFKVCKRCGVVYAAQRDEFGGRQTSWRRWWATLEIARREKERALAKGHFADRVHYGMTKEPPCR